MLKTQSEDRADRWVCCKVLKSEYDKPCWANRLITSQECITLKHAWPLFCTASAERTASPARLSMPPPLPQSKPWLRQHMSSNQAVGVLQPQRKIRRGRFAACPCATLQERRTCGFRPYTAHLGMVRAGQDANMPAAWALEYTPSRALPSGQHTR